MIDNKAEINLLAIPPEAWVSYLDANGWKRIPRKRTDIVVFQTICNGDMYQVTIPLDRKLSDYAYVLKEALATVSDAEGKDITAMLQTLTNCVKQGDN